MARVNFIDFYSSKSEAFSERTSPQIKFYDDRGIQLLPNNILPYIQSTNIYGGIELEDWTVIISTCDDTITEDVTDYFMVEDTFQNDNGDAQFTWSLTNVPFDFGQKMCYLTATQTLGETFYSNRFKLTQDESEKTTRIDYKEYESDTMQSIQLNMWYVQSLKNQDIELYYETSTGNTVSNSIKSQKYEKWRTRSISNSLFMKISDMFEGVYVYLNQYRCNLFENIEIKTHTGQRNSEENDLMITFNRSEYYDPNYVVPDEPSTASILLSSVEANGINAIYNFSYENIITDELVFDYSQDKVSWTSTYNGSSSPQSIPFNGTDTYYFRVRHPEAISNIIELELGESVIANNDSYQVQKGNSIELSVLTNDSLVGTTTIISTTTPTNGSVTIIDSGRKIEYTHNNSVTSSDSFTYTISNGITSDTATVSMVITESTTTATPIFMTLTGEVLSLRACRFELSEKMFHNGEGLYPVIGDFIFTDKSLRFVFNGGGLWYGIPNGIVISVNEFGRVTQIDYCY